MRNIHLKLVVLVAVLLFAIACDDTRKLWTDVLSKCATSDKIGSDAIYFGASNGIGPGSLWRQRPDGSYEPMFELSDMFPKQEDRDKILSAGPVADCSGTQSSSWEVKADLPFQGGSTPISGEFSADLKKASKITVKVNGWRNIDLKETVWKDLVAKLPDDSAFKKETLNDNRFLAETTVQVSGLTTTFEFNTADAINLKAKYPTGKTIQIGGDGLSLQVNWTSDTQLELNSPGQFYIMSEYAKLQGGVPQIMANGVQTRGVSLKHATFKHPEDVITAPRANAQSNQQQPAAAP